MLTYIIHAALWCESLQDQKEFSHLLTRLFKPAASLNTWSLQSSRTECSCKLCNNPC